MKLTLYIEPVAQGRPRITTVGGYARAYDPTKSKNFKNEIATLAKYLMTGVEPLEGALTLSVSVYRSIPKNTSRVKADLMERGVIRPIVKPDVSNYIKGVEDALNGICWHDDSQIVEYKEPFGKWYSKTPRIVIDINKLESEEK